MTETSPFRRQRTVPSSRLSAFFDCSASKPPPTWLRISNDGVQIDVSSCEALAYQVKKSMSGYFVVFQTSLESFQTCVRTMLKEAVEPATREQLGYVSSGSDTYIVAYRALTLYVDFKEALKVEVGEYYNGFSLRRAKRVKKKRRWYDIRTVLATRKRQRRAKRERYHCACRPLLSSSLPLVGVQCSTFAAICSVSESFAPLQILSPLPRLSPSSLLTSVSSGLTSVRYGPVAAVSMIPFWISCAWT